MTVEFADVARRYCNLIENGDKLTAGELVIQAAPLLAELYMQGLRLPEGPPAAEDFDAEPVSTKANFKMAQAIDKKLAHYCAYWGIVAPFQSPTGENSPLQGTIGDDLADIHRDLKYGLAIYDIGTEQSSQEAVWQWRFGLANHWGEHLVSCLYAIHYLLFKEYIAE